MKTTYVQFVIDKSGSMSHVWSDVKKLFAHLRDGITERSRRDGLPARIGLTTFSYSVQSSPPGTDSLVSLEGQYVGGGTALYTAVLRAIEDMQAAATRDRTINDPDTAFLVRVLTDGQDNASGLSDRERLAGLTKRLQGDGRWTFVYDVPPGDKHYILDALGVPPDNVREWEATTKGVEETKTSGGIGTQSYFDARAAGQTSVQNFYKVETNLATGVDVSKLTDFSGRFKELKVDKEAEIRPFVEVHTGKPYVIGSTYYQLTKREKIQPSKNVLIRKKGEKRVYGGLEAKTVLGLHTGPNDYNVVTPGNHGDYDIFVQSRTVNRKLVRGTSILIDTTKKVGDNPTWDHTLGGTR